jgi:iron complex transport system ATP-binding protein
MTASSVCATAVSVERGERRLLDSVSLEAFAGAVLGVVGPNGAGKSTLLRVLAGDVAPSSGSTEIVGMNPAEASLQELARVRAYVGPQTVSDIAFRVKAVVAMGRHPYRSDDSAPDADDEIVAGAMHRVDVAHLANREMRTLSSGEQQRVRIARAVAQQSPAILLDEPTSALDVGHQEMIMKVLREMAASGVAVLTVLHDLNLAAVYADRLLLLNSGKVVATGTPREVLTAARLTAAYRQPIAVIDHPFRDCPLVLSTG